MNELQPRELDELEIVASFPDLAMRTCSPNFYRDKVPFHILKNALSACAETARLLDALKKGLFYNRDIAPDVLRELSSVIVPQSGIMMPAWPQSGIDIMHGVIGIITEAGELAEWLLLALETDGQSDITNLHEELGDILWYYAPIFAHTKSSFAAEMVRVIRKLQTRFPEKYVDEAANNRDLDAERAILEAPADGATHPLVQISPVALDEARAAIRGSIAVMGDVANLSHALHLLDDARGEERSNIAELAAIGEERRNRPNLGCATNKEIMAEMDARESMGNTAPDYRTIDA